jgi:hypothetical protein
MLNGVNMGDIRHAHHIYIGKYEGKKPCEEPKSRWEDIIRMGLMETGRKV